MAKGFKEWLKIRALQLDEKATSTGDVAGFSRILGGGEEAELKHRNWATEDPFFTQLRLKKKNHS